MQSVITKRSSLLLDRVTWNLSYLNLIMDIRDDLQNDLLICDDLSDTARCRLEESVHALDLAREKLNAYGKEMDAQLIEELSERQIPKYLSIETSKQLIRQQTDKYVVLEFPEENGIRQSIAFSPKFISETHDGTGIVIRYYPDWKFTVTVRNSFNRKLDENRKYTADEFRQLIESANIKLNYERKALMPDSLCEKDTGLRLKRF